MSYHHHTPGAHYSLRQPSISRKLLLRLVASYCVVALIPLFFNLYLYYGQIRYAEQQERQEVMSLLLQSASKYDEAILALDNILTIAYSENDLRSIGSAANPLESSSNHVFSFVTAQKRMNNLAHVSNLVDQLILYNKPGQFAITSETTFLNLDNFTPCMNIRYLTIEWPDDLLHRFDNTSNIRRCWFSIGETQDGSVFTAFANSIFWGTHDNVLIAIISPDNIARHLLTDADTEIIVMNEKDEYISHAPSSPLDQAELSAVTDFAILQGTDHSRYMVCTTHSMLTGHRFYSVTPYETIANGVALIRQSIMINFLLVAIMTALLCLGFSWISTKSWDGILATVFGADADLASQRFSWRMINSRIRDILEQNSTFANEINLQQEQQQNHLLYDLLITRDDSPEPILRRLNRLGVSTDTNLHLVIIVLSKQDIPTDPAALALLIHKLLRYYVSGVFQIIQMTGHRFVLLVSDQIAYDDLITSVHRFTDEAEATLGTQVRASVRADVALINLSEAYWESLLHLDMTENQSQQIVVSLPDADDSNDRSFPKRLEQQIKVSIINGNPEQLEAALTELLMENINNRMLSPDQVWLLLEQIIAAITLTLMTIQDIPASLLQSTLHSLHVAKKTASLQDFPRSVVVALRSVLIMTTKETASSIRRTELGSKIVDYINEQVADPNLCLSQVADHFDLSAPYISSLVKDETGQGFAAYCERLRVANACELLTEGQQIQDVSTRVGYSNVHTFRRAFKKIVGVLPSEYQSK